jgi:hypothetical protein
MRLALTGLLLFALSSVSCFEKTDPRMRPNHPCRTQPDTFGCPSKAN